jgi:F-type H+-transporting ATPase subunit delta
MSQGTGRISKKYAKAMFEAIAPTELDSMRESLNSLSNAWTSTPELKMAVLNPTLKVEQKATLAREISDSIKSGDKELNNLIALLIENKRASLIPEIAIHFSAIVDEFKAALSVEITSAFEVSGAEKTQYEEKIRKDLGSLVKIDWKLDPEILGGMLIKSGDKLIDSSVKGSLEKMASQLLA